MAECAMYLALLYNIILYYMKFKNRKLSIKSWKIRFKVFMIEAVV